MANLDIQAGWAYHNATKHSHLSVRTNPHFLDWMNQPLPFKIYPKLELIPLPRRFEEAGFPALKAIAEGRGPANAIPDLENLSPLLYFSAGITRRRTWSGGEIYFRAAACTGALYEIELYLACASLPGLEAGLYHYAANEFGLRKLRAGDFRRVLVEATACESSLVDAPVIVICTGTYWRNAWKYQERTYRHFGWDNGTILANLLAISTSLKLPAKIICGFVDDAVNRLLDVEPEREVAFSLIPIGRVTDPPPPPPHEVTPLGRETVPLSRREVDYPAMRSMHAASSLLSPEDVASWRGGALAARLKEPAGEFISLRPLGDTEIVRDSTEQVILRRGSTRQFARAPISFVQLSTILDRSTRGVSADFLDPFGAQLNDLYLIVNAVEGLPSGSYFFHRGRRGLELLKEGDFRSEAGDLGLEQELPADASVAVFFLADLESIFERYGNRGYRTVQLEAGIIGGKLYLAAYALHLGASGLTFYDDDVIRFFSPHARGKSAVFLVALGKSAKQGRTRA
ncbi:MAG TPA: SagB family peptide dehydrogenase [Terriglobales bacterium]|nr:SagB family peptide dehydrogenase [Terriglobales bacterium]